MFLENIQKQNVYFFFFFVYNLFYRPPVKWDKGILVILLFSGNTSPCPGFSRLFTSQRKLPVLNIHGLVLPSLDHESFVSSSQLEYYNTPITSFLMSRVSSLISFLQATGESSETASEIYYSPPLLSLMTASVHIFKHRTKFNF